MDKDVCFLILCVESIAKNIREKKMTKTGSCVIIYQKKQKEGRKRDADFDCRG